MIGKINGYSLVSVSFGTVGIVWSIKGLVCRVYLPQTKVQTIALLQKEYSLNKIVTSPLVTSLHVQMRQYFRGERVVFDMDILDKTGLYLFQYKVLAAEHSIPYGRVSTYGAIARRINYPGAARAVGNALACNPFPIIIPCHRAVRADRTIGGFQGGKIMKKKLLKLEGVTFSRSNKVAPGWFM